MAERSEENRTDIPLRPSVPSAADPGGGMRPGSGNIAETAAGEVNDSTNAAPGDTPTVGDSPNITPEDNSTKTDRASERPGRLTGGAPDLGVFWHEEPPEPKERPKGKKKILRIGWPPTGERPVRVGRRIPGRLGLIDFGPGGWYRSRLTIGAFAALFFVVMLASALAAWRGGTGFDVLLRRFRYGGSNQSGGDVYHYDYSARSRFAALGNSLVVLSDTELTVLNGDGAAVFSDSVRLNHPSLSQGGGRAVAWDTGGTDLYVVDENGIVGSLSTSAEEPFLSARLNSSGLLAVTTGRRSGKGMVRVYDQEFRILFDYNSGHLVTDARVTDDNLRLAAVTLGMSSTTGRTGSENTNSETGAETAAGTTGPEGTATGTAAGTTEQQGSGTGTAAETTGQQGSGTETAAGTAGQQGTGTETAAGTAGQQGTGTGTAAGTTGPEGTATETAVENTGQQGSGTGTAVPETVAERGLPRYASGLVLYRLDSEIPENIQPLTDTLILEASQQGKLLTLVGDTRVSFVRPDTGGVTSWTYGGAGLRSYDLGGKEYVTLYLSDDPTGNDGRIVTVDNTGQVLGSIDVREEVLSVSASGRYVAVLYTNRLMVYNHRLQEYAALSGTGHLRETIVRQDGSVLLLGALSGGVFLP